MKGTPRNQINRAIHVWSFMFDLNEHLDKLATVLSGGMKRKLCTAISCIGNLNAIVLDGNA
jgi:ABC-type multidrug transport system ATPase subunit